MTNAKPTKAEVLGRNRKTVWLRVPHLRAHRILSVPRAVLKRGMASATLVEADIENVRHTPEQGWVADVEILRVIESAGDLHPEVPGEEGDPGE